MGVFAAITLPELLAVAAGAAVGAVMRWLAGLWLNPLWAGFPLGTLAVNALGGLLIGVAMVAFSRSPDPVLRLLLVTGFCGGFTTFSSFSAESLGLLQKGEPLMALAHGAAHVIASLACVALGFGLGRVVWR